MDVSDWRARIDEIDWRLLELLNERVRCVLKLSPLKLRAAIPVYSPEREREVIGKLQERNQGPLDDEAVRRIFTLIMEEMRAVQERERAKDAVPSRTD
ncbi:MAG TPA: chorismate mutase [Bryobacterales bacterium]|nr:chorismate mutase [Bryobacterales bacterium]